MRKLAVVALLGLAACGDDGPGAPAILQPWTAHAIVAGKTDPHARALTPQGLALAADGGIYVADSYGSQVLRVDPNGTLLVVAGNGVGEYAGDGGPAQAASLRAPEGVAVDATGNVYIADTFSNAVRKIDVFGTIATIAGTGIDGYGGDGGLATAAQLQLPRDVAVDAHGRVYIADSGNHRIRRIDEAGIITTIAGAGADGYSGDGGPATLALLDQPSGIALAADGSFYIADTVNAAIRKVDAGGTITTYAGNGTIGVAGEGVPANTANLTNPTKLAVQATAAGDVVTFCDSGTFRLRRVTADGLIHTFAGIGAPGDAGDGGLAIEAALTNAQGLAIASDGAVWIADTGNFRVRKVDAGGTIAAAFGSGLPNEVGDGGAGTAADLVFPRGVAFAPTGELVVADTDHHRVRALRADGTVVTLAGNGRNAISGMNSPATAAGVAGPTAITYDAMGRLVIAEPDRVRRVGPNGNIATLATGFLFASGLAVDPATGDVYVSDRDANVVKKIAAADNAVTTVIGNGTGDFAGDGGPASAAHVRAPDGVAWIGGALYVADTGNRRVRRVDPSTHAIATVAGDGTILLDPTQPARDGGPATAAPLYPFAVAGDAAGNLYIADGQHFRVRKVDAGGTITTIAGTGTQGLRGDGGPAAQAEVGLIADVAVAPDGRVVFADFSGFAVRAIALDGTIRTVVGGVDPVGIGPIAQAALADPRALAILPDRTLVAGGLSGAVESVTADAVAAVFGRYQQDAATGSSARFGATDFGAATGLAYDAAHQRVFVSEATDNRIDVVTLVDPADPSTWTIAPLAGDAGLAGADDGPAHAAKFRGPSGLAYDADAQRLFVADTGNATIRTIELAGGLDAATVGTFAGVAAMPGFAGDGGPATQALLAAPRALALCGPGDVFVADTDNARVRRIDGASGTITTVLGTGVYSTLGDDGPAAQLAIANPRGLACDADGDLFVTSTTIVRALPANAKHVVDGTGPAGTIYGRDRAAFPASSAMCLTGLAFTDAGALRVVDMCAGTLVELTPPSP